MEFDAERALLASMPVLMSGMRSNREAKKPKKPRPEQVKPEWARVQPSVEDPDSVRSEDRDKEHRADHLQRAVCDLK